MVARKSTVYDLHYKKAPEGTRNPLIRFENSSTGTRIQLSNLGVTFDGFTPEQLRQIQELLRSDSQPADFVRTVEAFYPDRKAEIADILESCIHGS